MGSGRQRVASLGRGKECEISSTMPLMLELKYEYFPNTWPGRIKLLELVLAFFCIVCSAPAYEDSQHWFLAVVVVSLLGSLFFSLYYLCLAEPHLHGLEGKPHGLCCPRPSNCVGFSTSLCLNISYSPSPSYCLCKTYNKQQMCLVYQM